MRYLIFTLLFILCFEAQAQKVRGRDLAQSAKDTIAAVIQDSISFPVDTTALKLLNMTEGRVAYLKDPAGWWTIIDSTYDESYCIIAAPHPTAAKQWTRDIYHARKVIYSSWTHAKGDNSNDDAQELQHGLDLMANASEFIFTSEDTFLISESLTLDYSGIYNFNNATIAAKSTFDTTTNVIEIGASDVTINDLHINGYNYVKRGIYAGGNLTGITINRANLIQCEQNIRFTKVSDFRILDCVISDTLPGGVGIYILEDNNDEGWIERNNIIAMTGINISGTVLTAPAWSPSRKNHILNNYVKHPTQFEQQDNSVGIVYTRNSQVVMTGNTIGEREDKDTGYRMAISVTGDTLDNAEHILEKNKAYWATDVTLEFYDANNSSITNNYFLSDSAAAKIRNTHNLTLKDNIFKSDAHQLVDGTLLNTVIIWGQTAPSAYEEADGKITNVKITGNTIIGGFRGLLLKNITADCTNVAIQIEGNFFDSQEYAINFGTGTASKYQDVKIDGNQAINIGSGFFYSTVAEFEGLSISGNQVRIDTSLADSSLDDNPGVITLKSADGVSINDNYFYGGGKAYPVKSTGTIRYATIADNVFDTFQNNRLRLAGRVKVDTSNTYVHKLPVQDNLVGWWAAEDVIAVDGDSVTTWLDRSAAANHLYTYVDSTASRPVYKENILNKYPAIRFDGTNDIMRSTSLILTGTAARTLFIVLANQDTTGSDGIIGSLRRSTYYGNGVGYAGLDTLVVMSRTNAGSGWDIRASAGADTMLLTVHWEDQSTWMRVNNAQLAANTDSSLRTFGSINTVGGKDHDVPNQPGDFFGGDILEIIVYNASFDTTETSNIESYLNDKYDIY